MAQPLELVLRALSYFTCEGLDDPYPLYAEMRERSPYLRFGDDWVAVTRYEAVKQVLTDPAHFLSNHYRPGTVEARAYAKRNGELSEVDQLKAEEIRWLGEKLLPASVGPDHTRRRDVFHRAFGVRTVMSLQSDIRQLVDQVLDALADEPVADVLSGFAPIPRLTHMRLLSVPESDLGMLHEWTLRARRFMGRGDLDAMAPFHEMLGQFHDYVVELVDSHRRRPGTQLFLATMIEALDAGEIDLEELVAMYTTVLLTGSETAMALLCTGILTLLTHRDEWAKLCERPGLASAAVEEVLRFEPPGQTIGRNVASGTVLVNKRIPEGCRVLAVVGSANRDPSVFVQPDRFWIERPDTHHKLSFGKGIHQCLGAALARLEARLVFAAVAQRFPDAQPIADSVSWNPSPMIRTPTSLQLDLGRPRRARPAGRAVTATRSRPAR